MDRLVKLKMELDKISNLPRDITNEILSKLPLRDVVRMSVLSSKWRHKWSTLSHLVFDEQLEYSQGQTFVKNTFGKIVDHVLLLHTGPIYSFELSPKGFVDFSDIDRWILYLSRTSFRELVLGLRKDQRYKLPSYLYSCQSLIHLELYSCLLRPPSTFNGFPSLTTLCLDEVWLTEDIFENLISGCPLLESLWLNNFECFTHVNICAPKLNYFYFNGTFRVVRYENTINLTEVIIDLTSKSQKYLAHEYSSNLVKFFTEVPNIQRLEGLGYFLRYLAIGNVPRKLPRPCVDLNYLKIAVDFHNLKENLTAICILRSSPNLQELVVAADPEYGAEEETSPSIWEEEHLDGSFGQLRRVAIEDISGIKPQLDFMKFLLANSPVLERVTVKPASLNSKLLNGLLHLQRSSRQTEITVLDSCSYSYSYSEPDAGLVPNPDSDSD